jgi:hypothetical protein
MIYLLSTYLRLNKMDSSLLCYNLIMYTHKSYNSNTILTELEARLLKINSSNRERLIEIASFSSSLFQGAKIARELINLSYLWKGVRLHGETEIVKGYRSYTLYNYGPHRSKGVLHLFIATTHHVKLRRILKDKPWNQSSVFVWGGKRSRIFLTCRNIIGDTSWTPPRLRILDVKWDKNERNIK